MRFVVIALLILLILVFLAVFIHFKKKLIIPGLFEPPVRTLRATIPENGSHIFR